MSGDKGLPLGMILIVLTVVTAVVLVGGLFFVLPFGGRTVRVGTTSRLQVAVPAPGTVPRVAPPVASPNFTPGLHADPSPLPAESFVASNGWRGQQGTTLIEVWAGVSPSDGSGGLVVFRTWTQGNAPAGFSFRPTPTKSGAVEVVRATDSHLTLRSEDGTTFTFDALNGAYV